jgi:hypothetical protein
VCVYAVGWKWLWVPGHFVDVVVVTISLITDSVEEALHHLGGVQDVVALIVLIRCVCTWVGGSAPPPQQC